MEKEKKKQHYVPQSYLEHWAIPDKYQVYVYDKRKQRTYVSNIKDVASERYFYDIDFTGILTENELKEYVGKKIDISHLDDEQYIENFFAHEIEGDFKKRINKITSRISNMNSWEIKNCCFLTEEDKFNLSVHLSFQFLRVKSVRNSMIQTQNMLEKMLSDMNASQEVIDRCKLPEKHLPFLHGRMILNNNYIEELTERFSLFTWILLLNTTPQPFFTSDNPIGTIAHLKHDFLSLNGFASPGVEMYFPLSPKIMLSMVDGKYHDHLLKHERRIIEIKNIEIVRYYNSHALLHCDERIFSNTDDFEIAEEMIKNKPSIFEQPRTTMSWGGKTYYPDK